jgi:glucose-1-phosphate adenylyltransferase
VASMGIYAFRREALLDMLNTSPPAQDFGKEVFPRHVEDHHLQAHLFDGYWEDLGTIKAYHEASLALASTHPPFDFHSPDGVIFTRMRFLPASRISGATLNETLISDGCVIQEGTSLDHAIIGVRSRLGKNCTVRNSVLIGADRFETPLEREANRQRGIPDLTVGDNTIIENAILDKDCRIGRNVRIVNKRGVQEAETDLYAIREGVITIPRGTIVPDGTEI